MEIPNHTNYIIYPDGRVYNKIRKKKKSIDIDFPKGYKSVSLYKNGKQFRKKIHILLATLFIENPNNYPVVDHYDGNITNNCLSNLRWVTKSQNSRNSKKPKNNTSGHMGVFITKWNTYRVHYYYEINKKKTKTFKTLEEAVQFRKKMENIYYPSMNQNRHF